MTLFELQEYCLVYDCHAIINGDSLTATIWSNRGDYRKRVRLF